MLAADLAERMRANPDGLTGYAVTATFTAQATQPTLTTACETYTNTCSNAINDMAAYDLAQWRRVVRSQLPEGSVSIATQTAAATLTAAGAAEVWLAWRDPAVASPSENTTEARNYAKECPNDFSSDKSVRCIYFRINL